MRLRRLMEHSKDQNWLAVVLDFFIVVTGVFIGLQVSEWNEGRKTSLAFSQAKARLIAESQANLDATSTFLEFIEIRVPTVRKAIKQFNVCKQDQATHGEITDGMNAIRGTATLRLRTTALHAITSNDAFLSLQTEEERERIKEFQRRLAQAQDTLDWLEKYPFSAHIEDHPATAHGPLAQEIADTGAALREIQLAKPLSEVCNDPSFTRRFFRWERTAMFQTIRGQQIREWLRENISIMTNDS